MTAAVGLLIGSGFWILGVGVTGLASIIIVGLRPFHESVEGRGDDSDPSDGGSAET